MRIGLHDADAEHLGSKNKFPNLALMKISAYGKQKGDLVEWWNPLCTYDKVYSSKIFDFTPENPYLPPDTVKGGTGYGMYNVLPPEIDGMFPDYSLYPACNYAIGFLTRGCPNKCDWCYVPRKEGSIRPYARWQDIVRQDTNKLVLMDNNILASPYGIEQLRELAETDYRIDLNQGMDVRLLTEEVCSILAKIKWIKYIRFSCDTQAQLPYFVKLAELFDKYKIAKSRVFVYTLVRKDLNEADERIQALKGICKNFSIYAQAERNDRKGVVPNRAQLEFTQRYVYGRSYKKETWIQYLKRRELSYAGCK